MDYRERILEEERERMRARERIFREREEAEQMIEDEIEAYGAPVSVWARMKIGALIGLAFFPVYAITSWSGGTGIDWSMSFGFPIGGAICGYVWHWHRLRNL